MELKEFSEAHFQTPRIPIRSWPETSGYAPSAPRGNEDAALRPKSQRDLSAYAQEYRLRQEAHESWQHTVTDEIVYLCDFGGADNDSSRDISEVYLKGDVWVEVEFILVGQRDTKYSVIIESLKVDAKRTDTGGKIKLDVGAVGWNSPMLVEVAHSVQPPQEMRFFGCSSTCWLKVSNDSHSLNRNVSKFSLEDSFAVGVPLADNREGNSLIRNDNGQFSQAPNDLVKAGTHTVKGVSASQREFVGNVQQLDCEFVPLLFKVCLFKKSARLRLVENSQFRIESIKMVLRPIQLQIRVSQA